MFNIYKGNPLKTLKSYLHCKYISTRFSQFPRKLLIFAALNGYKLQLNDKHDFLFFILNTSIN